MSTNRAKPDIHFAAMSLGWGNPAGDDLPGFLREVKSAGYEGVAGFADVSWEIYIDRPDTFAGLLADHGLALASLDVKVHRDLDTYRKTCAFMARLNCRHLVCLGGVGTVVDDYIALADVLNPIGEIAREHGVRAVYHNGRTRETFADMDTVLTHTDPEKIFAMCDTGHATRDFIELPVPERAVRFLEKQWDRIDFIEFKDWHPETELNTPVGEGLCDWDAVFALLRARNYTGWITVEQNGQEGPRGGRTPFECARISRDFIRNGLGV